MDIETRRVLITGANRGIGKALALACLQSGAQQVVAGARRPESLDELRQAAGADAQRMVPARLDVTREEDVREAAAQGPFDILINNAGVAAFGGVFKAKWEEIVREAEVNFLGVIRMTRAVAPGMIEQGEGLIVNIGSILGKVPMPAVGTYCATKAALLSLGKSIRADLADRGVRVVTVIPATVDTDMARGFDVAKMKVEDAVAEILEAIRKEVPEVAIGDESREIHRSLEQNPGEAEASFARFRA